MIRDTGEFRFRRLFLGVGAVALLTFGLWRLTSARNSVVVYCAHDAVFAAEILEKFEADTGISLAVKYDTEATKSLGLIELLAAEKEQPRCDVFWNNELLGMLELADSDILEPYRGPGWQRMPEQWKDSEARWAGFAARLRVTILNTSRNRIAPTPTVGISMLVSAERNLSRTAMAKPLYGTTLTHYTVLWERLGPRQLQDWHLDSRRRKLREVNGNRLVADLVASGECDHGFTDSDDYFAAKDGGAPVFMVPTVLPNDATICIPNTVGLIRGSRQKAAAQKLVDYLLSEATEVALANSRSRQIPLGPVNPDQIPPEVREMQEAVGKSVPLKGLIAARRACLAWLRSQYAD